MHPRHRALAAATLAAALAALALPAAAPAGAVRALPTPTPPSATTARGCRVETARDVAPARVALSETVAVTLTVRGCVPRPLPLHVAIVLDLDRRDEAFGDVRDEVFRLFTEIGLGHRPAVRVAVLSFDPRIRVVAPLGVSQTRARGALARTARAAPDGLAAGISRARELLVAGRRLVASDDRIALREVIIVFSPGCDDAMAASRVRSAARAARGQGMLVVTAATAEGEAGRPDCLRSAATAPMYFFGRRDLNRLILLFRPIVIDYTTHGWAASTGGIVITETLSPAFALVPATDAPPAAAASADGRSLTWRLPVTPTWPSADVTVTYRARPLVAGRWPLSLDATAVFTDPRGALGTVPFPPATLDVVADAQTDARVCPDAAARAPAEAIAAALAGPDQVAGWGQRCSPNLPPGPLNPLRAHLRLARPGRPYHPIANGLVWGCGCR